MDFVIYKVCSEIYWLRVHDRNIVKCYANNYNGDFRKNSERLKAANY